MHALGLSDPDTWGATRERGRTLKLHDKTCLGGIGDFSIETSWAVKRVVLFSCIRGYMGLGSGSFRCFTGMSRIRRHLAGDVRTLAGAFRCWHPWVIPSYQVTPTVGMSNLQQSPGPCLYSDLETHLILANGMVDQH